MSGRLLAIGDIHGCDIAFDALLDELAVAPGDTVVVLGDVVDRGPGTKQVVERLLELRQACRLVFVLGNHEEMMLDALVGGAWAEGWLRYGGTATLFSYGGDPRSVPGEHLDFLATGLNHFESERELFVHANLEPGVPLPAQSAEWLRWTHLTGEERPHPSGKRVICGHTPQKSGEPLLLPGWLCIDTFACGPGWLSAVDLGAGQLVQANQAGQKRVRPLE